MNFPGAVLLTGRDDETPFFLKYAHSSDPALPPGCTIRQVSSPWSLAYGGGAAPTTDSAYGYDGTLASLAAMSGGAAPSMASYTLPISLSTRLVPTLPLSVSAGLPPEGPFYWLPPDSPEDLPLGLVFGASEVPSNGSVLIELTARDGTESKELVTADAANAEAHLPEPVPSSMASQPQERIRKFRARRAAVTTRRLTSIAVFIAGDRGDALSDEWRSHLSGESGHGMSSRRQAREAAGFVRAALACRLHDAADLAWRPVDTLLESRELSNLTVVLATLVIVVDFLRRGGVNSLADHLDDIPVVPACMLWVIHRGRRYRQVKPPKRQPRSRRR